MFGLTETEKIAYIMKSPYIYAGPSTDARKFTIGSGGIFSEVSEHNHLYNITGNIFIDIKSYNVLLYYPKNKNIC